MTKILTGVILLAGMPLFAQNINASKVPASVKASFAKNFPTVTPSKWELEKGNYEANFKKGGNKMSALFDASGTWLETETAINRNNLPASANTYLLHNYKDGRIKETAKIELAGGTTNYEVEVNGKDLIFDSNGNFLKAIKD